MSFGMCHRGTGRIYRTRSFFTPFRSSPWELRKGRMTSFICFYFDRQIVILCARCYLRFNLGFRDLVKKMSERSVPTAHTDIIHWVQRYASKFDQLWDPFARRAGRWRADEMFETTRVERAYLYRAVDRNSKAAEFRLNVRREMVAARAFFCKTIAARGCELRTIALDGYAAVRRTVRETTTDGTLPGDIKFRLSNYLSNLFEGDYRSVKLRRGSMPGVVRHSNAAMAIVSVKLLLRLQKDHFYRSSLRLEG
jgi:transposase-like protein